jgi:Bacterial PH domain
MSIFQKMLGNAVLGDSETIQNEFQNILVNNENVVAGYKLLRDSIVFTNERLLIVNVQGLTGSKISYQSIPYSSIKVFSMETAGSLDFDCEIKLVVQGLAGFPISLKFKKGTDLNPIYKVLSTYTLRDN